MKPDTLAAHVRRLRTKAGISQRELGRRAGLGHGMVAKIEAGERGVIRPSLAVMQKLAAALGVPLERLIK